MLSIHGERVLIFLQTSLSYHSYSISCGHGPGTLREQISLPPISSTKKKMGLKRKIARYIKIIWVRTKSETVFLYPECMERCLKTKIMEEEEEEKGETIFFFYFRLWKTWCVLFRTILKPVISIFIAFVFVEGFSQETCDSPV